MSGIFLNEDCTHFIYSRYQAGIKVTESVLRDFISQYKNTQVTDNSLVVLVSCLGTLLKITLLRFTHESY